MAWKPCDKCVRGCGVAGQRQPCEGRCIWGRSGERCPGPRGGVGTGLLAGECMPSEDTADRAVISSLVG